MLTRSRHAQAPALPASDRFVQIKVGAVRPWPGPRRGLHHRQLHEALLLLGGERLSADLVLALALVQ